MIRTIIIKKNGGSYAALAARVQHDMSQDELIAEVSAAVQEFKSKDPEKYGAALVDGKFPWTRLYTHLDQGILERHGIDLGGYGDGWLTVEDVDKK